MSKKIVSVKSATKIFSEQFHDATIPKEEQEDEQILKEPRVRGKCRYCGVPVTDSYWKNVCPEHTPDKIRRNGWINKFLEAELNKQFPKGDRTRGKALLIMTLAHREIEKARQSERKKYEQRAKEAKSDLEFMSKTELAPIDRVNYLIGRIEDERKKIEAQLKEARECIQALVDRYVCNRGGKHQFIACSTPKGTPEHWKKAISIVESIEQENTACPLNEKERNKA